MTDDLITWRETTAVLAIFAGERVEVFGRHVEFTAKWPDGLPFGWTEDEFRQWCAEHLGHRRCRAGAARDHRRQRSAL